MTRDIAARRDTTPHCEATAAIDLDPDIWGDDNLDHQCRLDPGHKHDHRCWHCSHTWRDG